MRDFDYKQMLNKLNEAKYLEAVEQAPIPYKIIDKRPIGDEPGMLSFDELRKILAKYGLSLNLVCLVKYYEFYTDKIIDLGRMAVLSAFRKLNQKDDIYLIRFDNGHLGFEGSNGAVEFVYDAKKEKKSEDSLNEDYCKFEFDIIDNSGSTDHYQFQDDSKIKEYIKQVQDKVKGFKEAGKDSEYILDRIPQRLIIVNHAANKVTELYYDVEQGWMDHEGSYKEYMQKRINSLTEAADTVYLGVPVTMNHDSFKKFNSEREMQNHKKSNKGFRYQYYGVPKDAYKAAKKQGLKGKAAFTALQKQGKVVDEKLDK